ncbi:MAG: HEAT repeat domain-containing protein [Planctomycetota bacterium]|nr:MAG: HEAT repeat domain-containing protein [Planctomycetota bacterium]
MKNAKGKGRLVSIFTSCPLLLIFLLLLVISCNKSLPVPYERSDTGSVFVDELVPEATRIIQEALADDNPLVRVNAIEVVAAAKQVKLMPKVQRLLKDDFVPVRFAAALAVGDLEYCLAENSVKQLLEDEDENVKIAAAYALAELGSSENLQLIRQAIASSDQSVRANAALLLGKSGDESALKFLYWAVQHEGSDDKTRFQAAEAIAMLGDERIYPKLWTMLISAYADDRVVGIRAMGALGTAQAKNALITMLDDDILEVRLAAAEQLGMCADTTGEPEVLDVFTKNLTAGLDKESLERVNMLTALAIGEVATAPLTKFLPRLLEDESKFVRISAAKAVFQCAMKY